MPNLDEIDAHLAILEILDSFDSKSYKRNATPRYLRVFRPRCPVCRNVLQDSPWLDGLRLMWCRQCGHKYRECWE